MVKPSKKPYLTLILHMTNARNGSLAVIVAENQPAAASAGKAVIQRVTFRHKKARHKTGLSNFSHRGL
jgi:hypothetical protein